MQDKNECQVSIIYVNYNTSEMILDSIKTVRALTTEIDYEIIVVDNNSTEQSVGLLKDNLEDDIRLIEAPVNLGFGKANNLGLEQANGECIFFLNPDTLLINDAIKILYEYIISDDKIGAVGGQLFTKNMKPNYSGCVYEINAKSIKPSLLKLACNKLFRKLFFGGAHAFKKPTLVREIVGADLMIKKSVLDEVGAFDKEFFMYAEETELNYRIFKKGYKLVIVPQAKIVHFDGGSFENNKLLNEKKMLMFIEGNLLYIYKSFGFKEVEKFKVNYIKDKRKRSFIYRLINKPECQKNANNIELMNAVFEKFVKERIIKEQI